MRPNRTMTCARCGVVFSPKDYRQRYCSLSCSQRTINPRPCANCGAIFQPRNHRIVHCSIACGQATRQRKLTVPPEQRFWSYVNKTATCWLWTGNTNDAGYGTFGVSAGNVQYAHRYSWQLLHGPIPAGLVACHRCDTPRCVNPDHVFLGTKADNSRDMVDKGRSNRGSQKSKSVLTEQDVLAIRSQASNNTTTQRELAATYGVSLTRIRQVIRRSTWKHVP